MTSAPGVPPPPQEAQLIRRAREARGLSPEQAAKATSIRLGGMRWRQIERGWEAKKPPRAVIALPKTLAHMAHAVGITPERLEEAGRHDAADILREIILQEANRNEEPPPPDAPGGANDPRWTMLAAAMNAASQGMSPKERAQLRRYIEYRLATDPEWQPPGDEDFDAHEHPRETG